MRRSPAIALLFLLCAANPSHGQILDDTMVPAGQLRLQAHPFFESWDRRYGVGADGTEEVEELGAAFTDPTGLAVYPGLSTLVSSVRAITGDPSYDPRLGDSRGRVTRDVTRIDFGGHVGVFDWLTVGIVFPWVQTRTALDVSFAPDTAGGAQLGVNPSVSNTAGVDAFVSGLQSAASAADAAAASACAGGGGATCSAAQALAGRATALAGSAGSAYGASAFFPFTGSAAATDLAAASAALEADLVAAGLPAIGAAMPFATDVVTSDVFRNLAATRGAGVEATPLGTRRGLWRAGDVEASALLRVVEVGGSRVGEGGWAGPWLRLSAGALVRLPTGAPPDPDLILDLGTGDAQTDFEGRLLGVVDAGLFHLGAGVLYGIQSETTLTRRVAPHESPIAPLSTRREVRWRPASYLSVEVEPGVRVTEELTLIGALRYFQKGRDEYELVPPDPSVDPVVLEVESGVKHTRLAVGLRYRTVRSWRDGAGGRPVELHLRVIRSHSGSGGQVPVANRVEAGVRLFRRLWGAEPEG